jgi:chemotaxis protein histidine kinase CheA
MSNIDRQVQRTRLRLTQNLFWQRVALGVLIASGLWALLVVVARLSGLEWPLWQVGWVLCLASLIAVTIWTLLRRPTPLQAALVLDDAAGLRERISTAISLRGRDDEFVRAALHDAEHVASRVHVPSHVKLRAPEIWPWSSATLLAAMILVLFLPTMNLFAKTDDDAQLRDLHEQARLEKEAIEADFEQKRTKMQAMAKDNPQLGDLLEDIEPMEMPESPNVTPEDVRRQAIQKIDNAKDKLQRELEENNGDVLKEMQRRFQQLNQSGRINADDQLSQALSSGDFKSAKQALEDMVEQLEEAAKDIDDPEKQQQIQQMQQQLQQLAEQVNKLSDTTRIQKELQNKGGMSEEEAKKAAEKLSQMDPKQLQKELQKMMGDSGMTQKQIQDMAKQIQKQQQASKQMQQMAKQLQKAAQACQQCQGGGQQGQSASQSAAQALSNAMSQMSQLEMSQQMMNDLQAQLNDLNSMREDVCEGGYCPNRGNGQRQGNKIGNQGPNAGLGMGERIGKERTAYQRDPTKAKTRFDTGVVIGRMLVEGPQVRGEANAEAVAVARSELRAMEDAVERDELPHQYRNAAKTYFERLAGIMTERFGEDEKPAEDNAEDQ